MSTDDLAPEEEYGITEEDRRKMGEWVRDLHENSRKSKTGQFGLDGNAVATAFDRTPDDFTPAKVLATAWLFETGAQTAPEAAEATGLSYPAVKRTFNALVDHELAHTNSQAQFGGRGRNAAVYIPCPDGLPVNAENVR